MTALCLGIVLLKGRGEALLFGQLNIKRKTTYLPFQILLQMEKFSNEIYFCNVHLY